MIEQDRLGRRIATRRGTIVIDGHADHAIDLVICRAVASGGIPSQVILREEAIDIGDTSVELDRSGTRCNRYTRKAANLAEAIA